jgi:carboxyl-terminal processing protease
MASRGTCAAILCALAATMLSGRPTYAQQKMSRSDLQEVQGMLRDARDAVKRHYYDLTYHGVDLDARYNQYEERIKAAPTLNEGMRMVAAFLSGLKDSHTFFVPPGRPYKWDYGFRIELVGNTGYISRVRPGTDAVGKVQPGDEVVGFDTYSVNRTDFHDLWYTFDTLMPQTRVQLDVRDPEGNTRRAIIDTKFREGKNVLDFTAQGGGDDVWNYIRDEENADQLVRQRYIEMGNVLVWKMPEFDLDEGGVDHIFDIARKHDALVLDLRGNPGGTVVTLDRMIGDVMDHDVAIGNRVGRKEMKPLVAKTAGNRVFKGKIVVLVDSQSASAAEIFARVMQLENRGVVIGDRSSGSVMEARLYGYSQGLDTVIAYGFSVTEANLIMKDGQSLEHIGVTPDQEMVPTAADLAAGRDPVLAQAIKLAGGSVDSAAAGKMFPFEWAPF